jgi:hypothetical protein
MIAGGSELPGWNIASIFTPVAKATKGVGLGMLAMASGT